MSPTRRCGRRQRLPQPKIVVRGAKKRITDDDERSTHETYRRPLTLPLSLAVPRPRDVYQQDDWTRRSSNERAISRRASAPTLKRTRIEGDEMQPVVANIRPPPAPLLLLLMLRLRRSM